MAIAVSLLTSGNTNDAGGQSATFTTASVSPGADCALVLLYGAQQSIYGEASSTSSATSSGSGPSWTRRVSADNATEFNIGVAALTAEIGGSDPGAFTVTVDYSTEASSTASITGWALYKVTGHDTGTPYGGKAATTGATRGDGAESVTLDAAPATGDVTLALSWCDSDTAAGATFDTGWTESVDWDASSVSWCGGNSGYRESSTSTTVAWTDVCVGGGTGYSGAQVAIVVKAAAGTGATVTASSVSLTSSIARGS